MADNNLVMEERKESMVSLTNKRQESILRTAHFLTPSIKAPVQAPLPYSLTNAAKSYKDLPFKVNFRKLKYPTKEWAKWVDQMGSLHHLTWKKAGIFDAIMSSTSVIYRNTSLIYGFVEKWCPVTNSFVFPWGEATVTLEDMIVLGGYSVLGDSVLISTPENSEMKETVKTLRMERLAIVKSTTNNADHNVWMKKFMDSGSEIEHEAFLAYWLSRFVFPILTIGTSVLSVAVRLSRGIRIALAPAVLAGMYHNMSLLKATITAARKIGNGGESVLEVKVSAPLALVQVWIWERFPNLRPKPNSIGPGEPRIARWHNLREADIEDLSRRIDSAAKNFEWRPYTKVTDSSLLRKTYVDDKYWVLVETELDEELERFIRCLRASELVSLEANCIEQYLPHRVAMQFGMDQDLPGYVARENENPEIAWSNYNRPIRDRKVYVPPRLYEPGVTTRYLKWWEEINCGMDGAVEDGIYGKSSSSEDSKVEVIEDEDLVPSSSSGTEADFYGKYNFKSLEVILFELDSRAGVSRPDFCRKAERKTAGSSSSSGISKPSKTANSSSSSIKRVAQLSSRESCGNRKSKDEDVQGRIRSSSTENNGDFQELTLLPKPAQSKVKNTLEKEGEEQWIDVGLRLEERVIIIEKLCDLLKTGKVSCSSVKKLKK